MDSFEKTENGFKVSGSIVKITSKISKGGAVQLLIECPLNPDIAKEAYSHLEKIGTVALEYVKQPELELDSEGSGEEPGEEEQDPTEDPSSEFDEEEDVDIGEPL